MGKELMDAVVNVRHAVAMLNTHVKIAAEVHGLQITIVKDEINVLGHSNYPQFTVEISKRL